MTVKILIADDQVLLSRALATILGSQLDLEVVATVHDGQAAVDTVAPHPPSTSCSWMCACQNSTVWPP